MEDAKALIAQQLRSLLLDAEERSIESRQRLDAVRRQVQVARTDAALADSEAKRIRRALVAIEEPANRTGRPRGGGDPTRTRLRVKELLPTRLEWTGVALRAVLAQDGHEVTGSAISAALAALAKDGYAYRTGRGRWAATMADDGTPLLP